MDVDMIKATVSQEDHMDMMAIIMQMEKLPEFTTDPNFHNTNNSPSQLPQFHLLSNLTNSINNNNNNITTTAPQPLPMYQNPSTIHNSSSSSSSLTFLTNSSPVHQMNALNPYSPSSEKRNASMAAMREMIFRIAAMQPINIDPETIKPPKRRNVKISKDPQSVAARHRRERISERIRILQRLVPGGTKMDTASMLDEAIHYVKFLKKQVQTLEQAGVHHHHRHRTMAAGIGFASSGGPVVMDNNIINNNVGCYSNLVKSGCLQPSQMVGSMHMFR